MPLGLVYTAGRVEPSLILLAGCRGGRAEQTRQVLMQKLYEVVQVWSACRSHTDLT
jgi:hypothetical protein